MNLPGSTSPRTTEHDRQDLAEQREFPETKNLDEYYLVNKKPYGFEYFNIDEGVHEIPSFQKWAQEIDDFIKEKIEDESLDNSLETYHNIMDVLVDTMGLHPDTENRVKMKKLYGWIKGVLKPQLIIDRRKRKILDA